MATATGVSATGNSEIDGLLAGSKWTGIVTYSFPDSPIDYPVGYGQGEPSTNFAQAPVAMQVAVAYAFAEVMSYTNLVVTYAGTDGGDIRIAQSSVPATSWGYYPANGGNGEGGDVWFGKAYPYGNAALGNYTFDTAIHELGHALGLKHSQETGGVANVAVPSAHDNLEYSVMSYRSYAGETLKGYTNEAFGFPQSYMANDILALQTLYGANFGTHSENTTYSWNPTTGQEFINGVGQAAPGNGAGGAANRVFMTVWDGNGVDTYDLSNYTTNTKIDLNPGAYSVTSATQIAYLGDGHYAAGNVYNAYLFNGDQRSYIDNAIGGSGNDTLVGNIIANALSGGGGNDTFTGGGGNDTINGGSGTDVAVYSGARSSYLISYNSSTQVLTLADQRGGTPDGTDMVTGVENFQFADGSYSAAVLINNHAPVVSAANLTLVHGQLVAASGMFSVADSDGDAMTVYGFLDGNGSASSGHFTLNGVAQAAGSYFLVSAAELSQVAFVGGTTGGVDNLTINTFDGLDWGVSASFQVSSINHAPVLTSSDVTIASHHAVSASSLFSVSDTDADPMSMYGFLDGTSGASSGYFTLNGVAQAAGSYFLVNGSQLSQVNFVSGALGSVDSLTINSFDGADWGNSTSLHVSAPVNHAPVFTASDVVSSNGHSIAASTLFSAADSDGDAVTLYGFMDGNSGASSGHFTFNGVTQAAGSFFLVDRSQLSQVSFVAGSPGSVDHLTINGFDGTDWGTGVSLDVSVAANHAPTLSSSNVSVTTGHAASVSSLFSVNDADGDPMATYGFMDGNGSASSGHFVFNGVTQAAGSYFLVSGAQLSQVSYVAGTPGSVDHVTINAFDGTDWGPGTSLDITTAANHAPVLASTDVSVGSGRAVAASGLFSVSDADGDAMSVYGFFDSNTSANSGHFVFNGVTQAAGSYFLVSAAQLSQVSFAAGLAGTSDNIRVNSFDGTDWGAETTLHVDAIPGITSPAVGQAPVDHWLLV